MIKRAGLAAGFTLIEMAIVLVVIGLIISGGLVGLAPVLQSSKITETNARLDRIEQALILHVIQFGCLPCPAAPTTASTVATAGQADAGGPYTTSCNSANCTYRVGGTAPNQGVVPWAKLGLTEADVTDGFGYRIDYAVTSDTVSTNRNNLQQDNGMRRDTSSATPYPAGALTVTDTSATPITLTTAAAYVLISHGPDRSLGYAPRTGVRTNDPNGSAVQTANSDGSPFIQDDVINLNGNGHFDDIVRWRTAPMIVQLCGSNACGNP